MKLRLRPGPSLRAIYDLYYRLRAAKAWSIRVEVFGAKAFSVDTVRQTTLAALVREAATPPLKGTLLYYLTQRKAPQRILELGTHVGFGTMYLAAAAPQAEVHSVEASETLLEYARRQLRLLGFSVKLHQGVFEAVLPSLSGPWDMVYLDGNHRAAALQAYVEMLYSQLTPGGWMICDDIFWSREMWQGWRRLRQGPWQNSFVMYPFGVLEK